MTVAHHRPSAGGSARRGGRHGARAVVILLGAMAMVSMLVIAALVVDMGGVYSARRRDQNSADAAALAGAQETSSRSAAATTAIAYAEDDLGVDLSDATWNSCTTDPGALAVRATGRNCISFNTANSRLRVRIPDQYYATAFGQVIGKDKIRHSAFAIAGIHQRGFGGVLPFGMPAGAGTGDGYACIKSNSGGQSEAPCDGPDSGNFGTIDIGFFGNEDVGTTKNCGSGQSRTLRIPNNIAAGSDHELGMWKPGDANVIDTPDACSANTPSPNAAVTETGNLSDAVESSFIQGSTFSDGGPARLRRFDNALFAGNGKKVTVRGNTGVDNNGLWTFIPQNLTGDVPTSCRREQFVDAAANPTLANLPFQVKVHVQSMTLQDRMLSLLRRCFTHYAGKDWSGSGDTTAPAVNPPERRAGCSAPQGSPCKDPVFSVNSSTADSPDLYDIQYTPRFAYVPEMAESTFPSGTGTIHFKTFRATFIQRLVLGTGTAAVRFDPGISDSAVNASGNGIREVTLFVFPPSMLPNGLAESGAYNAIGKNRFPGLVR